MAAELTIAEKLQKLWDLQQVDSRLDEIQILRGELPMEVADLEDEIAGLDTRIKKLKGSVKDAEADIHKLQAISKDAEANIKRYQKQMDDVKNNREYEALGKEIELAKLDIQLSEKKMKDAKAIHDQRKDTLTVAEAKFTAKEKDLVVKKAELQNIIDKTEKDEEKLRKHSDKARVGIDDRILKGYDKIRKTYRNGLAVVPVERDSCGGCYNRVPPQVKLEIGLHKKIMACDHCGRILADVSVTHIEEAMAA